MGKRALAIIYVILVGLSPACTRGCSSNGCNATGCGRGGCATGDVGGGDPVPECTSDRDCAAPERCRRNYCRTPQFADKDDFCRAHPSCKEAGHCGAERVRSFLGHSETLECVAVDVADCKASTNCALHGRCTLETADEHDRCIADQVADCQASTNCKTREECVPSGGNCVRELVGCTPVDDELANDDTFARDLEKIGDTTPGAIEDGLLACVSTTRDAQSFVRVNTSCTVAPFHRGRAFVRHVSLAIGDRITVAVQDHERSDQHDPLLAVTYTGSSPMVTEGTSPAIACHALTRADADAIGMRTLAEIDHALVAAKAQRLGAEEFTYFPDRAGELRSRLAHAAAWLGANRPEIATRAHQLDDLEATHRAAIEAKLDAAASHATPPTTPTEVGDHLRVTAHGLVCGDALAARYAAVGDHRTLGARSCAVELVVENRGTAFVSIGWLGIASTRPAWLRPHARAGVAAYEVGAVIDARADEPTATAAAELHLDAGAKAIVLYGDAHADLELGATHTDADALLRFATWGGPTQILRTDFP